MPRISVVVPIYNVEPYLARVPRLDRRADLRATSRSSWSTTARRTAAPRSPRRSPQRDPASGSSRQPNGGLGNARNTGIEAATRRVPGVRGLRRRPAAPRLRAAAAARSTETGSDFATGNVPPLRRAAAPPVALPGAARSAQTRLKTHITQFRPLLADRIAWNKLFRRSFWDEHGLRFPEGVIHEDIPVDRAGALLARVGRRDRRAGLPLPAPRERRSCRSPSAGWSRSVLRDRAGRRRAGRRLPRPSTGRARPKRWYDESVVADDLRYYLNVLDRGRRRVPRAVPRRRVNALLDGARAGASSTGCRRSSG